MGRRLLPKRITPLVTRPLTLVTTWGISSPFGLLSPTSGQITNALLTRSPLETVVLLQRLSFDLHVLGTPPAFILSQDQTLRRNFKPSEDGLQSVLLAASFLKNASLKLLITIQLLKFRAIEKCAFCIFRLVAQGANCTTRLKPVKHSDRAKLPVRKNPPCRGFSG